MKNNILLLWCVLLLLSPCALAGGMSTIKVPPYPKILVDGDSPITRLKKSYDQGNMLEFYQQADAILDQMAQEKNPEITEQSIQTELWLFYLITSAPFLDVQSDAVMDWMMDYSDLDYEVKERVIMRVSPKHLLGQEFEEQFGEKASICRDLFVSYLANLVKQFKQNIDPAMPEKQNVLKARAIEDPAIMGDDKSRTLFFNRMNTILGRNRQAQHTVKELEQSLIPILVWFYPSKAVEVKKYLRLAGYKDEEMPDILDRTIGRVPEAAYLYKGFPKRRH